MTAWPWLAVAGVGALHGLNPATGWAFVAAWGVRSGDRTPAWRALAPIAAGHAASVAAIAALAALGLVAERGLLPWLAGGLAVFAAAVHVSGHLPHRGRHVAGQAGLALWSFTMGTAHGAGMMLVPALIPLCLSGSPVREITATGSLVLMLAAVALHMATMLAVTAAMAATACRGLTACGRRIRAAFPLVRGRRATWNPRRRIGADVDDVGCSDVVERRAEDGLQPEHPGTEFIRLVQSRSGSKFFTRPGSADADDRVRSSPAVSTVP